MQHLNGNRFSRHSRRGSALLLMLLVSVAIGCVIYFISARSSLGNLPLYENPLSSHDVYPWENSASLLDRDEAANLDLSDGHPPIDDGIENEVSISETGSKAFIFVSPEGKVNGAWSADYNSGKDPMMNFMLNAEFKGNIDPAVIYFDEDGEDRTKLFMIAEGDILVVASEINGGGIKKDIQQLWVTGWIDQDQTIEGEFVMVNTRGNIKRFAWKTSFASRKRRGLL